MDYATVLACPNVLAGGNPLKVANIFLASRVSRAKMFDCWFHVRPSRWFVDGNLL